jgi:hypothetical protein
MIKLEESGTVIDPSPFQNAEDEDILSISFEIVM